MSSAHQHTKMGFWAQPHEQYREAERQKEEQLMLGVHLEIAAGVSGDPQSPNTVKDLFAQESINKNQKGVALCAGSLWGPEPRLAGICECETVCKSPRRRWPLSRHPTAWTTAH